MLSKKNNKKIEDETAEDAVERAERQSEKKHHLRIPRISSVWAAIHNVDLAFIPKPLRFFILLVLTALFTVCLEYSEIPAALLLGPMISAIILSLCEIDLKVNTHLFTMAQGIIGCMVGSVITPTILHEAATNWPLFLSGVLSVIFAATAIGYFLAKKQIIPGTVAIWGSAAGGASAMVLMAEAYNADVRLVAVMQYIRVVLVALMAALLAHFVAPEHVPAIAQNFFPAFSPVAFLITLLIAFGGGLTARFIFRIPAGGMLFPFLITVILQNIGIFSVVLPPWLPALFYIIIGWNIGLRFTRPIVMHAFSLIPVLLLSTITLMAICSVFAVALSYLANVDLLTAYLATSPGGADSISIIAASTTADMPFVMAYQSTRLILVTLTGPLIASSVANYLEKKQKTKK